MSSKAASKPTIFNVAELAGVSIKTVSRVVNREPNVQEKTRKKVEAAIDKLGYRPNVSARGLSSKRAYVIGLIYENPQEFSYVKDVLNSALSECETLGYSLVLKPVTVTDGTAIEDIRKFATQTRMDGVLLPPPMGDTPGIEALLRELGLPCARLTPISELEDSVTINCDDEESSFDLTRYVITLGHERIGFVKGHPDHRASHDRFHGYERALESSGIEVEESLICQGYFDFESGQSAASELLDLEERPTAIIAANDDMAAGVLHEVHERGLAIPEEISVAGFDDTVISGRTWPPLTTVRQPIREMTRVAVRQLVDKITAPDSLEPAPEFHCAVIVRGSTGPRNTPK